LIRYFITFLVLFSTLFANDDYELKLYEKIFSSIYPSQKLKIYSDDTVSELLKKSDMFIIVSTCDDANILIGKNFSFDKKCTNKPQFATSYNSFINNENVIGAFYWRKGRPQIKFKKDILNKFNITLPKSLEKFSK